MHLAILNIQNILSLVKLPLFLTESNCLTIKIQISPVNSNLTTGMHFAVGYLLTTQAYSVWFKPVQTATLSDWIKLPQFI